MGKKRNGPSIQSLLKVTEERLIKSGVKNYRIADNIVGTIVIYSNIYNNHLLYYVSTGTIMHHSTRDEKVGLDALIEYALDEINIADKDGITVNMKIHPDLEWIAERFEKYCVRYDVKDYTTGRLVCYRKKDNKEIRFSCQSGLIEYGKVAHKKRGRQALMDIVFNKVEIECE